MEKIYLPRFDAVMENGIIEWIKKEGDKVRKDEPIARVEGEKTIFEIKSPIDGIIHKIFFPNKAVVPVGEVIAIIAKPDEKIIEEEYIEKREEVIKATPKARKIAKQYNVDLSKIIGTGPEGRITEYDVLKFIEQSKAKLSIKFAPKILEKIPIKGIRKAIAERLTYSYKNIPSASLIMEIEVDNLLRFHEELEKKHGKEISFTAIITKAVAEALKKHRILNSSFEENEIKIFEDINISIAIDTPNGLLAPTVLNADKKSIIELSEEIRKLIDKAIKGGLSPEEAFGGTFTISNLGPYDIDVFIPIINPPQSAILGIGKIVKKPIIENNEIVIKSIMSLCLVFDHRVIDGVPAANFLKTLKEYLENPHLLS
ncbi:MAG: dihydrolipoamide acetyltransferase family protein [Nitrososphaerota archaeon]